MDQEVTQKLKQQLDAGKSFQEVSAALQADGFSHMQIVDAKILLDSQGMTKPVAGDVDISANPELAAALLQVNQATARQSSVPASSPSGGPIIGQRIKTRTLVVVMGTLVIIAVLFWLTGRLIK